MSAITSDHGGIIHYEPFGQGRPVVLVHSWVGSWRYMASLAQVLAIKFRVYAIDLFGFGDSARKPTHYTLEHQLALLEDFMDRMGIQKTAMIGHGLGAVLATEFVRRHPDKVPRTLLVSAPLYDPGDLAHRVPASRALQSRAATAQVMDANPNAPTLPSATSAMRAALLAAARAKGGLAPELEQIALGGIHAPALPVAAYNPLKNIIGGATPDMLLARAYKRPEDAPKEVAVDARRADPRAITASIENFDAGTMLDRVRQLPNLVMLIHGGDDTLIPPPSDEVLQYVTADKESSLIALLLPKVGHFPMLEEERFARLASEFLEVPDISKLALRDRWVRRNR
ncbi:MAG: alpha/beta hydrolase [Chloroflexota bacterium]|nr:alpha/beta hydrolase [Chloroflexota bacterium]